MPNIVDSKVATGAYDTSGNGGRKLVRLNNGTLVAVVKDTANNASKLYKSINNGSTWANFATAGSTIMGDATLSTNGTHIYLAYCASNVSTMFIRFSESGSQLDTITVDQSQTALGNVSLAINEAGTELHAAWSSKNATYPSSSNIRYAKGTINASTGAITWGVAEQVTKFNTASTDIKNQSIVVKDNEAIILCEWTINPPANYFITALKASGLAFPADTLTNWSRSYVYNVTTHAQHAPSAIFVPKSVNGLANGRIWVTWYGMDSVVTSYYNIRVSYSDDGGVTWSAMKKLTTETTKHMVTPVITANKLNQIFILFPDYVLGTANKVSTSNGSSWSSHVVVANGAENTYTFPSAIYDPTFNFEEPLFIYMNPSYIGFYGKWIVLNNSVPQGSIGTKDTKNNLLSYAITTDGAMSTITEKVNGVTVGSKTATSGQTNVVGLSQAQWDAVTYGKYVDSPQFREKNTLTISMGAETWTYTFDKRLPTGAGIEEVAKALQDTQGVFLPAVKSEISLAIRGLGGSVQDNASWETFVNALKSVPNRAGDTAALASSVVGTTLKLRASNGYRDGVDDNVTITDANFASANIANGVNVLGVVGTLMGGARGQQQYGVPGTYNWTVPSGINRITLLLSGAGGGGGFSYGANGGGGGGGGCALIKSVDVTPGQVLSFQVGAGGAFGTSASPDGQAGGNSSLGGSTLAFGGSGGRSGSGGSGLGGIGGDSIVTNTYGGPGGTGGFGGSNGGYGVGGVCMGSGQAGSGGNGGSNGSNGQKGADGRALIIW
ncbi:glycine-rich domain-containing protein [Paenibacillus macquariensis]|uniref:Glycine-rich domain-containing protein n=1 Tax=Paenibacillus macquariensis TaxID=948756 RepID=A0ABY1JXI4_9BACL|nr:hypothetical protein [Paenibacillus macquariensis]MEC0089319.1 hypothetical protein [Paenibacillus macquariensis]OAB33279.1 hypothetical protein PMSM_14800 [Paenibacillus macquariensis subsp. macquariensis]SIQ93898.1 hypothetical protein SAMN05421578_105139 [Paenibacillus macquariensis]